MTDPSLGVRIDKWLWAARFYKTRNKAKVAVQGGKVHVNGTRVKASRVVQIGDHLAMNRGITTEVIVVRRLSAQRSSAPLAQRLYEETEESINRRQEALATRKMLRAGLQVPKLKPSKSARQDLINLKRQSGT